MTFMSWGSGDTCGVSLNLSPRLYTLYTHYCTPTHSSNTTIKFADDTTVVGLISEGDAYRAEVEQLTGWCRDNNLVLNTTKMKELIDPTTVHQRGLCGEGV